jgi:membrane-associated phospholipid phosphatase
MRTGLLVVIVALCLVQSSSAQSPVSKVPDAISWGTAFANPTLAAWDARHSKCELGRLALSAAIENGVTFALKSLVVSKRPCLGCDPTGFPSGHAAQSAVGLSRNWRVGIGFTLTTAALRMEAHRHTWQQVTAGALIGIGSEALGRMVKCE